MRFEAPFFEGKQVLWDQLKAYGFQQEGKGYVYKELLLEGSFEARLTISPDGAVQGQLIDQDTQEPYIGHEINSLRGAFVGQVRKAYQGFLESISETCFDKVSFKSSQANRLMASIQQVFGDVSDSPFKRIPMAKVFRHPDNQKWYALLMTLTKDKLTRSLSDQNQEVAIMNVKITPESLSSLLAQEGFYPSYHMSKTSWVTVLLEDTVSDELVLDLVRQSRSLVSPVQKKS